MAENTQRQGVSIERDSPCRNGDWLKDTETKRVHSERETETDRQTDRQRQTDRETDRQTDRHRHRQTDRQTETQGEPL